MSSAAGTFRLPSLLLPTPLLLCLLSACGADSGVAHRSLPDPSAGGPTATDSAGSAGVAGMMVVPVAGGAAQAGVTAAGGSNTGGAAAGGSPPEAGVSGASEAAEPTSASGMPAASGAAGNPAAGEGGIASGGSAAGSGESDAGSGAGMSQAGASTMTTGCGQTVQTGTFQAEITVADQQRGYFMSVPESYDPNTPNRLFFGYHGSGWNGEMMRGYLDLEKAPLLEGSIFVYPDGLPPEGDPNGVTEWNLSADGPDIAFFDALYEQITEQYCVDETRVFVNGQSFGGLMTNAVGCARGNIVRAIAVVAGSGPRGSCQGQVAAWLTHGEDDESVSFSSGEASRDHWLEANHCADTASPGEPPQCQNYDGCDPGYPVIWCPHVNDGGHQHPSFGREAVRAFFATF